MNRTTFLDLVSSLKVRQVDEYFKEHPEEEVLYWYLVHEKYGGPVGKVEYGKPWLALKNKPTNSAALSGQELSGDDGGNRAEEKLRQRNREIRNRSRDED